MDTPLADTGADTARRSPREWVVPWLAVAALVVTATFRRVASWDVWWHLAIGREAVRTRSTVPLDTFSYSFAGHPYVHKDLLADVLFFGAFDRLGFGGLFLVQAVALVAAAVGIRLAVERRERWTLWVALVALFVAAVQARVIPRPLVFTVGAFPLMLGLVERARRRVEDGPRAFAAALLPAVALQWAWLNLHRGGLIGLVLLLGLALSLGLQAAMHRLGPLARIAGPRPSLRTVGAAFGVFGAAVLAGLVNPSGTALYRSGLAVTHDPIHRSFISEWQPLTLERALTVHPVATGLLAVTWLVLGVRLLTALSGRWASRPRVDVWHVGVLALFTYQGIASMRWLTYASAAAVVALALVLGEVLDAVARRRPLAAPRPLVVLVALVGMLATNALDAHPPGLGPVPGRYPTGALRAADVLGLGPHVHNTFVYGGYTVWASDGRRRVLVDGRNDMVYPSEFFLRCVRAQDDIEQFAELWRETGGDWVLADNTPGRETFRFLSGHPEWMAVYWSEEAVIYVLRDARPDLAPLALRFVDPAAPVPSLLRALQGAGTDAGALEAIGTEVARLAAESPDGVRANTLLALYWDHFGPSGREARDAVLDHLDAIAPDHPAVVELRSRLLGR